MRTFAWTAAAIYLVLLIALTLALVRARGNSIAQLDTPPEQQAWQQWRDTAANEDGKTSPVKRRMPKSAQPPALVLLRDHFGTCLAGAILLTSILYWASAFFVRGALLGPQFQVDHPD